MEADQVFWTAVGIAAGLIVGPMVVFGAWRLVSLYKVRRAGPAHLVASRHVIWRDPGDIERLDLVAGPGGVSGAPQPPFVFLEEHTSGTWPCVSVRDAAGRRWRVKFGDEVSAEVFASRLAWAAGFFVETNYRVADGVITGASALTKAQRCIDGDGRFAHARFELDEAGVRKLFDEHGWAWHDNPFVSTPQLNGLKILLMLVSNWDNKDVRDVARGSNTAIFEYPLRNGHHEARYLIIDWGGSMGRWGSTMVTRGKWDAGGFAAQTPQFVTGVDDQGHVQWGYTGQRTADAVTGIALEDVRWLTRYLGRLTDAQLEAALQVSGATPGEVAGFTRAIRDRIEQLRHVASAGSVASRGPIIES